ncbi:MAG: sugar ABC transporter permease [Clostridia bacterium]|nr:sugar ABC transporter permease [Clostridia bacterium]MBR6795139.1 sugar ABC transporter permease [Clostridia bacterium]
MKDQLKRWGAVFILPTLIAFAISFLVPFVMGIYLSFTDFTTVTNATFVGADNYIKAFTDNSDFLNALWFTVKFTVVSVISINVIAFLLAYLLTGKIKGTNAFRTVFFMPNLIGGIVLGYIWQLIINGILGSFGLDITVDASYGFWGLVVLMNWQMVGYMMIIYIAALQNVPPEMHEVAAIDGANRRQSLRHVILPLVMPAITICTFLTLTNAFKVFDQNYALTGGAPGKETSMLALDIFRTFYGSIGREGVGQAKAVIFFLIVALIALLQMKLSSRFEKDE